MGSLAQQTAYTVANAVRLSRTVKKDRAALLLEGKKDLRLYGNFIDWGTCEPYAVSGRETVLQALEILRVGQVPGVAAIVDVDSDFIFGRDLASHNLFLTDCRDLEGMLIESPALEKVLTEFDLRVSSDFREKLSSAATYLGYLRALAKEKDWSLDFKPLTFGGFLNPLSLSVEETKVIPSLLAMRENMGFGQTAADLERQVSSIVSPDHPARMVAQGHDVTKVLCAYINALRKPTKHVEIIESYLRLAFEADHFRKTALFASLCRWQRENRPFVMLRYPCP